MALDLEKLNIIIESNSKDAEKAIDNLSASLEGLKTNLNNLSTSGKNGANGIKSMGSAVQDLGKASSKARSASENLATVSQSLKKVSETAPEASKGVEEVADKMKQSAPAATDMTKRMGELESGVKKAGETTKKTLKETAAASQQSESKLATFFASIKRIAMYRAIRTALKSITTAFREGLQMFVDWDRNHNNSMAGAANMVDDLKAKWFELKGAIGAAIAPLLQSLQPIITWFADRLIDLFNLIQQIIRALRGEEKWYRAVYVDAKNTTKQAKELKRVLFGFDELNVLPSLSGSGTGSAEGFVDFIPEDMPEWTKMVKPVAALAGGILAIVAALKLLKAILDKLKSPLSVVWDLLKNLFGIGDKRVNVKVDDSQLKGLEKYLKVITEAFDKANKHFQDNKVKVTVIKPSFSLEDYIKEINRAIDHAKKNPVKVVASIPKLNFSDFKKAITDLRGWVGRQIITIKANVVTPNFEEFKKAVVAIISWVSNNPVRISGEVQAVDFQPFKESITATQTWLDKAKNYLKINTSLSIGDWTKTLTNKITAVQKAIKEKYIVIAIKLGTNGMSDAINTMLEEIQKYLNEHPLKLKFDANYDYYHDTSNVYGGGLGGSTNKGGSFGGGYVGTSPGTRREHNSSTGTNTSASSSTPVNRNKIGILPSDDEWFTGFASGGSVPNVGSLIWAGERGAEVVADMGNRTGVMNVSQMENAVANGNLGVINALYAAANMVVNTVNGKNLDVYLDGAKVGKSVTQYQNNQTRRTGTPGLIGV